MLDHFYRRLWTITHDAETPEKAPGIAGYPANGTSANHYQNGLLLLQERRTTKSTEQLDQYFRMARADSQASLLTIGSYHSLRSVSGRSRGSGGRRSRAKLLQQTGSGLRLSEATLRGQSQDGSTGTGSGKSLVGAAAPSSGRFLDGTRLFAPSPIKSDPLLLKWK